MTRGFKNILIIKPSSLGDIVLALPALTALRKSFPDARISWLIRPEFAEVLQGHPHLDDIILFDRNYLGKAWFNPRAFGSLLSLIVMIRKREFDAVIDLQGLFRTASLSLLSGCKKRFGLSTAREFAHLFYTHRVIRRPECIHLVDYYLEVVKAAGGRNTDVEFVFPENAEAENEASRLLKEKQVDIDSYAVLIPGSAHREKCWPVERFAALADKISAEFGLSMVAAGSRSEKKIVQALKDRANVNITDLAGLTSLSGLIALLRNARLVVGNDTGPGHIAAALGVPLVMIFGRANPARIAPYHRDDTVAAVNPKGRGMKPNYRNPEYHVSNVTFDEVYRKACSQLKLAGR